jgi:hypothetical protein
MRGRKGERATRLLVSNRFFVEQFIAQKNRVKPRLSRCKKTSLLESRSSPEPLKAFMSNSVKDTYLRIEPWICIVAAILIPIVVYIQSSISEKGKLKLEYVRTAVAILQPVKADDKAQPELRQWAADVLQKHSDVKIPENALQSLVDGSGGIRSTWNYGSGTLSQPTYYNLDTPKSKSDQKK